MRSNHTESSKLDTRFFFGVFLADLGNRERLRDDIHCLTYWTNMNRADVLDMTYSERQWHIERLVQQKKDESEAHKKHNSGILSLANG